MKPVVIDTNCLLQIIPRRSPYRKIWDAFLDNRFVLCVSNEILVSEDNHFNVLREMPFPQINLVTLDEFIQTSIFD